MAVIYGRRKQLTGRTQAHFCRLMPYEPPKDSPQTGADGNKGFCVTGDGKEHLLPNHQRWPWGHPDPVDLGDHQPHENYTDVTPEGGGGTSANEVIHPYKMVRYTRKKVTEGGGETEEDENVLRVYFGQIYFTVCAIQAEKIPVMQVTHAGANNQEVTAAGYFGILGESKIPGLGVSVPEQFADGDETFADVEYVEGSVDADGNAVPIVGELRVGFWLNSDDHSVERSFLVFTPEGEAAPTDDPCGALSKNDQGGWKLVRADPHTGKYFVLVGKSNADEEQQAAIDAAARADAAKDRQEANVVMDGDNIQDNDPADANLKDEGEAEDAAASLIEQVLHDHINYAVTIIDPTEATTSEGYSSSVPPSSDSHSAPDFWKGPPLPNSKIKLPVWHRKLPDQKTYYVGPNVDAGGNYAGTGNAGGQAGFPDHSDRYDNADAATEYASGWEVLEGNAADSSGAGSGSASTGSY